MKNKKSDCVKFVDHVHTIMRYEGAHQDVNKPSEYDLITDSGQDIKITIREPNNHKLVYSVYCRFLDTDNLPIAVNNQYSGKHNLHISPVPAQEAIDMFNFYFRQLMQFD